MSHATLQTYLDIIPTEIYEKIFKNLYLCARCHRFDTLKNRIHCCECFKNNIKTKIYDDYQDMVNHYSVNHGIKYICKCDTNITFSNFWEFKVHCKNVHNIRHVFKLKKLMLNNDKIFICKCDTDKKFINYREFRKHCGSKHNIFSHNDIYMFISLF
jgi:hypothetical protein